MKIEFHVIENANKSQAMRYLCQLTEQAYADGKTVYVHTNSKEETDQIDKLLWIYRDDSFLPHSPASLNDQSPSPIQIGHENNAGKHQDILINLAESIPDSYQQFSHLVEIVFTDTAVQQQARERYRQYRERGHNIITHKKAINDHDNY